MFPKSNPSATYTPSPSLTSRGLVNRKPASGPTEKLPGTCAASSEASPDRRNIASERAASPSVR